MTNIGIYVTGVRHFIDFTWSTVVSDSTSITLCSKKKKKIVMVTTHMAQIVMYIDDSL